MPIERRPPSRWTPTPHAAMSPNSRKSWMTKKNKVALARQKTKEAAERALVGTPVRFAGDRPLTIDWVIGWEKGRKTWEDDNLKAAMKAYQDGLADALGIDDTHFIVRSVRQERDPAWHGYVIAEIRQ